jgi:hypothetical protein
MPRDLAECFGVLRRKSEISLIGVGPYLRGDLGEQATARLVSMLGQLGEIEFGGIAIRLFILICEGRRPSPVRGAAASLSSRHRRFVAWGHYGRRQLTGLDI